MSTRNSFQSLTGCKSSKRIASNRLRLETLETRQMMAADTVLAEPPAPTNLDVSIDEIPIAVAGDEVSLRTSTQVTDDPSLDVSSALEPSKATAQLPIEEAQQSSIVVEATNEEEVLLVSVAALDASYAELGELAALDFTADQTSVSLGQADETSVVFGGKSWEDSDVVSDLGGFKRKAYDDYAELRERRDSKNRPEYTHEEACKKLNVDPDSDKGEALERIYNNDKKGKR